MVAQGYVRTLMDMLSGRYLWDLACDHKAAAKSRQKPENTVKEKPPEKHKGDLQ